MSDVHYYSPSENEVSMKQNFQKMYRILNLGVIRRLSSYISTMLSRVTENKIHKIMEEAGIIISEGEISEYPEQGP